MAATTLVEPQKSRRIERSSTQSPVIEADPISKALTVDLNALKVLKGSMKCTRTAYPVKALVDAWNDGSLKINQEYQRGATWSLSQMQGLVDSLFREYPIPPIFLHEIKTKGLSGEETKRYEIVDGQQRIRALREFFTSKFPCLSASDRHLRLPNSLRAKPCAWGKSRYSDLTDDQRLKLENHKLDVFLITEVSNSDEIRDLFIRLQSGTALSRQQVRDAWPGTVGPLVEQLAGKLDRKPSSQLFQLIDKRGTRGEDDKDNFAGDRQFCAQLLALFLARESDPGAQQSVGANELDKVYHENTTFDVNGVTALRFKECLDLTTQVFNSFSPEKLVSKRRKFRKIEVMAVFLLMQDYSRNSLIKLNKAFILKISALLPDGSTSGKSSSGPAIASFYDEWRRSLPPDLGVRLDQRRVFDEEQKQQIWDKTGGKCAVCNEVVEIEDAEYDHYPVPHRDGGKTEVENGRLVHREHHPRGRPASEE